MRCFSAAVRRRYIDAVDVVDGGNGVSWMGMDRLNQNRDRRTLYTATARDRRGGMSMPPRPDVNVASFRTKPSPFRNDADTSIRRSGEIIPINRDSKVSLLAWLVRFSANPRI